MAGKSDPPEQGAHPASSGRREATPTPGPASDPAQQPPSDPGDAPAAATGAAGDVTEAPEFTVHASCVAFAGRACLIRGASGSGKSTLALELMACGATLVADDRTILRRAGGQVRARAPEAIRGLIEARHVGLLRAEVSDDVPLALIADLDRTETDRLPPHRTETILGCALPLLHKIPDPGFAAAIRQYLQGGRAA
ncbi:Hpr(Ser) kinase/phosphatase [Roseivivax lentus]|uniref:Hpr(Ser) kinase/phosphatase n=1 Tax=Roseivivax lentus TaxID=633194 RepID=A0A1N7KE03_9RHOB|nr:Hpr(Ser) kinase/phosphatase [Roseivivax lentus]